MKRILVALLALAMALSLGACAPNVLSGPVAERSQAKSDPPFSSQEQSPRAEQEKPPTVLGEFAKLGAGEGDWTGSTAEQRLEDFDYLYKALQENYPYFHVLERTEGVNLAALYEEMRPQVEVCASDAAFYALMEDFTRAAKNTGHLGVITPFSYDWYVEGYKDLTGIPEEAWPQMERLANAYGAPKARAYYEGMNPVFMPVFDRVQAYFAAQQESEPTEGDGSAAPDENVVTSILEPGKIAYIGIQSFDMGSYEQDKQKLMAFYREVKDYPHVIFDISTNGGGGMSYFDDLVVAPNISKPLEANTYHLMKDGAINLAFLGTEDFRPVSELPELPRMNADDLAEVDLFLTETYRIEPLPEGNILNGRLWLLVSGTVFSSSEYAAMFTKATGFMTLVGTTTGGDGIGSDPLPIMLPNSGLLVRYSPVYGVTPDGAGSQEFGTEPDIIAPVGETALDTCLRAIAAQTA